MPDLYIHHRLTCAPRRWQAVADALQTDAPGRLAGVGGVLHGIWRSQIGRPRDELNLITAWPAGVTITAEAAAALLNQDTAGIRAMESTAMLPTLRPDRIVPPRRQGNFAFRWFETPARHWNEFLDLCASAWPGFETAYDSQVIGLWRLSSPPDSATAEPAVRSLLLTRRPDLAMWERSKLPQGAAESEVRQQLSRRYDLCDWTVVYTTTLLTADDRADTARWT